MTSLSRILLVVTGLLLLPFYLAAQGEQAISKQAIDSVVALPSDKVANDPAAMAELFSTYYKAAEASGYKQGMAKLLSRLSLANYYLGKYEKSTDYSLRAIDLFEELKDTASLGNQYCELGYELKRRDLDKAFTYMRTGLGLLERSRNRKLLGDQFNNFGVLFEMKGNIDSAIYFYRTSAEIKKESNDNTSISFSYNNIFQALLISNHTDSALYYLDQSTALRQQLGDEFGLTENYTLYGDYYFQLKRYAESAANYRTAMERSLKLRYTYLVQYTAKRVAECYELMNEPAQAIAYFKIYSQYKDSLTNIETNKAIAGLEIQFESEKKEKELAQHKAVLAETELKVKQRNYVLAGLALVIVFIIVLAWYIYKQQRFRQERLLRESQLKDQIAQITLSNKLQEERLRISRDLHDNIGSQLTFIISSLDNLSILVRHKDESITGRIKNVAHFTRDTITQLRDTIWAMNKEQITGADLQERLINYIARAEEAQGEMKVSLKTAIPAGVHLSSIQGMNIFRVIQEATNNALKHAKASAIVVSMEQQDNALKVNIHDNGKGFDAEAIAGGYGLMNMQKRIKEIGGTFEMRSSTGTGTSIDFSVPVN
jgi:signal transduction histidine kinase